MTNLYLQQRAALYNLKRRFGGPIDIYKLLTCSSDPKTGKVSSTNTVVLIGSEAGGRVRLRARPDRAPVEGLSGSVTTQTVPGVEVAVGAFLRGELGFMEIPKLIQRVLSRHREAGPVTLERILRQGELERGSHLFFSVGPGAAISHGQSFRNAVGRVE